MKTPKITYYHLFWISFLVFVVFYVCNICNYKTEGMSLLGFGLLLLWNLLHCIINHTFKTFFEDLLLIFALICIVLPVATDRFLFNYNGISIIRYAQIEKVYPQQSYKQGASVVQYRDYDSARTETIYGLSRFKSGTRVYVIHPLECSSPVFKEYKDTINYSQIHDFAFLDDKDFYTYHDFSLIKPDLVYYQVGYNVLYKASCDTSAVSDSTILLSFNDVLGKGQIVKYSVKGYQNIPDTFLVYRNINEKIDTQWHVCAPEVNTPENRAKISDYGYIFHYDVYSKQEIESQCPRIRDYVEQYKKRHIIRHTVSSSAS